MSCFRDIPIKRKLTLLTMGTSIAALLLVGIMLAVYERAVFKRDMAANALTVAKMVGANVASSLTFNDPDSALETLASLAAEPNIVGACVYDGRGQVFAKYSPSGKTPDSFPPAVQPSGQAFMGDYFGLFEPIQFKGDRLGTIYLQFDLAHTQARFKEYAVLLLLVIAVVSLLAFLVSNWLQEKISKPISHLAKVAADVAVEKDYSIRAQKSGNDELGNLMDGFNEMLTQIQVRERALQESRDQLEKRVKERTQELNQSLSLVNATLESTADGILVTDSTGKLTHFNERLLQMWKLPLLDSPNKRQMWEASLDKLKIPGPFLDKMKALEGNPEMESFDILEFQDGRVFECYSKPQQIGEKNEGRVWSFRDITERRRAESTTSAFAKLGESLSSAANQEDAARIIIEISKKLFGWDCCWVKLYDVSTDMMHSILNVDTIDGSLISEPHQPPATPSEMHRRIMAKGAELILRDKPAFHSNIGSPFGDRSRPSASLMIVPIRYRDRSIGLLSIQSYTLQAYTERDVHTLQTLADQCGGALERIWANEAWRKSESQFRLVWDSSNDGMRLANQDGTVLMVNEAYCRMAGKTKAEVEGKTISVIHSEEDADAVLQEYRKSVSARIIQPYAEQEVILWNGQTVWFEVSNTLLELINQPVLVLSIYRDVTQRKQAEAEYEIMNRRLLETSRQAGMAEVATGVIHNVGNALNSVNVSATLVCESVAQSKAPSLTKVASLLQQNEHSLEHFFSTDPRGKQLVGYLSNLATHLVKEQKQVLDELALLQKNIGHIKEIVAMQQNYAKISGVTETVKPHDLMEDALRMNSNALARHQICVVKEYVEIPTVTVERHKVLQILNNLIGNAKYACEESRQPEMLITLRVHNGGGVVKFSVTDNGVGITRENLTRIFAHGFTTRKTGHGFGLHSGALAAKELGGTLTAHSEGPGKGATFVLQIPFEPKSTNPNVKLN